MPDKAKGRQTWALPTLKKFAHILDGVKYKWRNILNVQIHLKCTLVVICWDTESESSVIKLNGFNYENNEKENYTNIRIKL